MAELIEQHLCMDEHVSFGMKLRGLLHSFHGFNLRQNFYQQTRFREKLETAPRMRARKQLDQLIPNSFLANRMNFLLQFFDCRPCVRVDFKIKVCCKTHGAEQPEPILPKPL